MDATLAKIVPMPHRCGFYLDAAMGSANIYAQVDTDIGRRIPLMP
ncbi:hypothetical protein [Polaromonas sp. CG9_12]|nr:hypothetical protein [Polaromonas sp. CG9_12]